MDTATYNATSSQPLWKKIYWITFAGFVLRLVFALNTDNIHHPDELFQYAEQAHRLVFGYGLIPWEYRFGIRSWLLPILIALPLYVCKFFYLDQPYIYIPMVKTFFCLLSTSVIFSGYIIARNIVSETAGRLAAIVCAAWYELIYFSFRTLTEVVATYILLLGLACVAARPNKYSPYLLGLSLVLGCALRPLYTPVAAFLFLLAALRWNRAQIAFVICTLLAGAAAVGFLDYVTWGGWFASYYNNYIFNTVYNISSTIFGTKPPQWYISMFLITSCGMFAIAYVGAVCWWRRMWTLIVIVFIVIGTHSMIPHKEYRHVFMVIPVLVILTGCVIALFAEGRQCTKYINAALVAILFIISLYGFLNTLPEEGQIYSYTPLYETLPGIPAYNRLSEVTEITSVATSVKSTQVGCDIYDVVQIYGSYYYLHHNVPIYRYKELQRLSPYVSHAVTATALRCPEGFEQDAMMGCLQTCKRINHVHETVISPHSTMNLIFPQIDDKYVPAVKPFLP